MLSKKDVTDLDKIICKAEIEELNNTKKRIESELTLRETISIKGV